LSANGEKSEAGHGCILSRRALFPLLLAFSLYTLSFFSAPARAADIPPKLSLTIQCTNAVIKTGDEIDIEFLITNQGTNDFRYGNRNGDRSGRMPEYQLTARTESGEVLADPRAKDRGGLGGGGFSYVALHPGESYKKVIPLNIWAQVKEPGRYVVAGTYLGLPYSTNPLSVSAAPIIVTVQPRSEAELDDYIQSLTNQLASLPPAWKPPGEIKKGTQWAHPELDALVMKLAFTGSPKVVPALLHTLYEPGNSGFWEIQALMNYLPRSPEIGRAIIATASERGLDESRGIQYLLLDYGVPKDELKPLIGRALAADRPQDWAAGARLASRFSDDDFNPRLIAIAATPGSDARESAIFALSVNRTDQGVRTLKTLINDPDPKLWRPLVSAPLVSALEDAGQTAGNFSGRPWRTNDITVSDLKPLMERLLALDPQNSDTMTGLSLWQQFGGDEFTQRVIAFATNPNAKFRVNAIYALAFNRTDAGVQTLKQLLNDRQPEIRRQTEAAIRSAYTSRENERGQPLKPDDFDPSLQVKK